MEQEDPIVIVDGLRTPFIKSGGEAKGFGADDLGAFVLKELLFRNAISPDTIDEVIMGNVIQPADAANVARVAALKAQLPVHIPAYTVQRNCASGMESITTAAAKLRLGEGEVILAGGCESMSNVPLLFGKKMTALFYALMRARTLGARLQTLARFRLHFLKPIVALELGLTDPTCGLIMGLTAENLVREFVITREEQDAFALSSHQRAFAAQKEGRLAEEIMTIPASHYKCMLEGDNGPREEQTLEALAKLRPYFDRATGSVTIGNSCPITDGAAALLLCRASYARARGWKSIGVLRGYAYAALEGSRMGLGPTHAIAKLLDKTELRFQDFDLIEINEAFAGQVLANVHACASDQYAKKHLNRDQALGEIDMEKLNVNGGAIALGHPVGASGTRLVLTMLKELKRRNKRYGLATLCVGGGQGAALALEVTE